MGLSRIFIGSFLGAALLFYAFPELDIRFSMFFYDPASGFYLADAPFCRWIYESVEIVSIAWVVLAVLLLAVLWIRKKNCFGLSARHVIYLLAVLAIGPGLIVNIVLKDNWGRARPYDVIQFGGKSAFTPAFVISRECRNNCAFVSGHAAMGFYFIAFGFLCQRRRTLFFLLSGIYGTVVGLVRILQGGHFPSDVVFAFFIIYALSAVLYWIMFERKPLHETLHHHSGL
ncbi:MAG: phosphatase PAP2 family protein [Deltaproteobacteria bacterium]|nr:phosphatase PAP2 family protein [Deltaproteobacteria bacterium]